MIVKKFLQVTSNEIDSDITFSYDASTKQVSLVSQSEDSKEILPLGELKDEADPTVNITLDAGTGITIGNDNSININTEWLDDVINGKGFAIASALPTKVSDLTNDAGYITGYVDTTYAQGTGVTITSGNIVEVDQEWLEGFVANLGYIKVDSDTIYHADENTIILTVEEGTEQLPPRNVFSINTTWLDNYINGKGFLTEHQSLSAYALKQELPSVEGLASETFVNEKIDALSADEVGSDATLANYATGRAAQTSYSIVNIIKQDNGIISATAVALDANNVTFTPIDWNSRDTHFSLSATVDGNAVQAKTVGGALSSISKEICTIYGKLANAALKSELPDVSNFITEVPSTYALKTDLPTIPTNISEFVNDVGFITIDAIPEQVTYTGESGIVLNGTTFSLDDSYIKTNIISTYLASVQGTSQINNRISSYLSTSNALNTIGTHMSGINVDITTGRVGGGPAGSSYIVLSTTPVPTKVSDLENDTGFITSYENTTYNQGNGIIITSGNTITLDNDFLSGFVENLGYLPASSNMDVTADETSIVMSSARVLSVSESWVNDIINEKGFLTSHQDISNLALKSEIPEVSGFALKSEIPVVPENISVFNNDAGYLTAVPTAVIMQYMDSANGRGQIREEIYNDLASQNGLTILKNHMSGINVDITLNRPERDYFITLSTAAIPTNVSEFTNDAGYLTEHQSLSAYAQLSDIPAAPVIPTKVSELNNDKSFVTLADLEAVKATLLQAMVPTNMSVYTAIESNVNEPDKNVFVETTDTLTSNTTFNGKNITVTELTQENSNTSFTSTGDVTISNMDNSGTLPKATSNAQVIINTPGRVVITDGDLAQNGYNVVEIGLAAGDPPKSVLIDHVDFTGNVSNNAISIFGTADDAVVTISNCTFAKISNALRLSNRTNASGVIINIENCEFTEWDTGAYAGMIICQDYTSTTAEAAIANNLFGNGKITINIINCTHAGSKIEFSDPATVCATGDANQIIYVYYDKGGIIAYDANKYPVISAQ